MRKWQFVYNLDMFKASKFNKTVHVRFTALKLVLSPGYIYIYSIYRVFHDFRA
jgi:hypothetical protein